MNTAFRAETNIASEGISEDRDVLITKSISQTMNAKLTGLFFTAQGFERYRIGDAERIDCTVKAEISKASYNDIKRSAFNAALGVAPDVAAAIRKKQARFFEGKNNVSESSD
jgi:hypothetical protein